MKPMRARLAVRLFATMIMGAGGLLLAAAPTALAQTAGSAPASIPSCQYTTDTTHSYAFCSTGQMANVVVQPNSAVSYQFSYPGDNSDIMVTSQIQPVDPTTVSAVGFNVFDSTPQANNPPAPVETATIQTNDLNSDPHLMQFNYSSGKSGPVTLQMFNYTTKPVTFGLNDSGLVLGSNNGAIVTPVTLQLASGASPATPAGGATAPAAPVPGPSGSQPAPASGNAPASIPSCQYTTDTTHFFAFCSTGQTANVTVQPNSSVNYRFNYPGDNSDITVTSQIQPVDPTTVTAVGFNVFDSTLQANNPPAPVETATIQSNELNSDPHLLQFNYSSGQPGPVTFQLFNYTTVPVTFSLSDSGLVLGSNNGAITTPVTLQRA